MKILVVGNGAREHAIAWKCIQSPLVKKVFVAPGNAGTMIEPGIKNIAINFMDVSSLVKFAQEEKIDLTIVGPEGPLIMGIVDTFRNCRLNILGPTQSAAQIEGSKIFTKDFLYRHKIPTAKYKIFSEMNSARSYVRKKGTPIVIKADGLAFGKGAIIAMTFEEADNAIFNMLNGTYFGEAGKRIIIEEYLQGEEVSFIVMVDGDSVLPLSTSRDHKQVGDGNTGPNTGGMGAYSPAIIINDHIHTNIMEQIILPTVDGMKYEGNTYTGFLYAGLIIDKDGNAKVIEFNCRSGDPEMQTLMLRLNSDLIELSLSTIYSNLNTQKLNWNSQPSVAVVLASKGYPGYYSIGYPIYGLSIVENLKGKIFHYNTSIKDNCVITNGGRVICATSMGENFHIARDNAYKLAKNIYWNGSFYRRDIGEHVINYK